MLTEDLIGMLDIIMVQMPWLFVAWMTCVGGAIGSFLNVVVYRMPAGMSISHPPSRCPKCETPIRIYDNIPVLGWIFLQGKCRNCKLSIATRYPIVEATVATIFGLLAHATVFDLDVGTNVRFEFVRFLYYTNGVACLVAFALIDFDGHRFPRRLMAYAGLTIFVAPLLRDNLQVWVVPTFVQELPFMGSRTGSLPMLILQTIWSGFVASWLAFRLRPTSNLIAASMLVGVLIGWFTLAVPVILASAASELLFLPKFDEGNDDARQDSNKRRLVASSVTVLTAISYVFILLQLYTGGIFYFWFA